MVPARRDGAETTGAEVRRFLLVVVVCAVGIFAAACGGESVFAASTTSTALPTSTTTTTSTSTSTTVEATTTSTTVGVTASVFTGYTDAEIAYFREIAGGAEFNPDVGVIHRWDHDVRITVHGDATEADLVMLRGIVGELNVLVEDVEIGIVPAGGNVDLHFAPQETFGDIEPNYIPGNSGFFWVTWNAEGAIEFARVLVASEGVNQEERAHLIREEITQCLGLMNDSWEYTDSIFYQGWTAGLEYTTIDRAIVEMLYRAEVQPGMSVDAAVAVLQTLNRRVSAS